MKKSAILLLLALLSPLMLRAGDKKDVAVGNWHALVLKQDGSLWTFGRNGNGQLGDGTTTDRFEPVNILNNVVQISAQGCVSMAVKSDGSLWAWGENDFASLGDGTKTERHSPVKIMDNVRKAAAGWLHAYAIDRNGGLWAWGTCWNGYDNEDQVDFLSPVKVMSGVRDVSVTTPGDALIVCEDGSLYKIMYDYRNPRKIMDNVVKVSCNGPNLALRRDGSLWTWGLNSHGELGDGTTDKRYSHEQALRIMTDVTDISSGLYHGMAVRNDGSLWAWGSNEVGQLGDGTTNDHFTPVKIEDNVRAVACGVDLSAWITCDGELRMVGKPFKEK